LRKFAWNGLGNVSNAAVQLALFACLAHGGQALAAGVFALAWSYAHVTFSFFGMQSRGLAATDVRARFAYPDYRTCLLWAHVAAAACVGLVCLGRSWEILLCVALLGAGKALENMSDVLFGFFQRTNRIHWAGQHIIVKNLALGGVVVWAWDRPVGAVSLSAAFFVTRLCGFTWERARAKAGQLDLEGQARGDGAWKLFHLAWPMGMVVGILALTQALPRFFLEKGVDMAAVGAFAAVASVMALATSWTNSVGQYYATLMARCHAAGMREALARLVGGVGLGVLLIGALWALLEPLWGPWVVALLDGHIGSRAFLRVMAWAAVAQCGVFVLGFALSAMREFTALATWHGIFLGVGAVFQGLGIAYLGLMGAAWATLGAAVWQMLCMGLWLAVRLDVLSWRGQNQSSPTMAGEL
jgi:O-antigen/teichoic acid export membrane protein